MSQNWVYEAAIGYKEAGLKLAVDAEGHAICLNPSLIEAHLHGLELIVAITKSYHQSCEKHLAKHLMVSYGKLRNTSPLNQL